MKSRALSMLCLLSLLAGCGSHSEKYSVSVKNETTQPLTIGFTKDGEPYQDEFMSPEDIALDPQVNTETHSWGILVPPGKTADTKAPMKADLQDGAIAYVRIYRGHINLGQILAISRGSSNRIDVPLMPGQNDIVVTDKGGRLTLLQGP